MAIVTSLYNSYFSLDLPDVQWQNAAAATRVRVAISNTDGTSIEMYESYAADSDDAVTLRGLAELVQPYVKPCPTPLADNAGTYNLLTGNGVWAAQVTRANVVCQCMNGSTQIGSTLQTYAYYSSRRTSARPGNTWMWLSRYTDRTIVPSQPMILSAFQVSGMSVQIVAYNSAGTQIGSYSPSLGGSASTPPVYASVLHYTLSGLASLMSISDASTIASVEFLLKNSSTVMDTVRFRIDRNYKSQLRLVAFTNCFGMLETEAFTGSDERNTEMSGEYSWVNREYDKIDSEEVTTEKLCAGHLFETKRSSLRDMAISPEVYLFHENGTSCLERMTVTAVDMSDRRPRTEPQTAYITLRRSNRNQEVVERTGVTDPDPTRNKVFDYTFDDTFN